MLPADHLDEPWRPGSVVDGKYRVERQLGKGGMGVVFEAVHLALGTRVALKCLAPDAVENPTLVERFFREARAAAQLQSEHVCRVLDVGDADGTPFLVMELLEGTDLGVVARRGPLDVATTVDYVRQACAGLAAAHARQIVHRDLKPENLFLCRRIDGSSVVKIVDFGVAKTPERQLLTGSIQMIGSPAYMSPEQMRSSRDVDGRTDVWALGVILFRLVSGRLPFPAGTVTELALQILDEPPAPLPEVPAAFAAVVLRCLEKEPGDRYATVEQLALALRPFGTEIYSEGPGDTATVALAQSDAARGDAHDLDAQTDVVAGATPITWDRAEPVAGSDQTTAVAAADALQSDTAVSPFVATPQDPTRPSLPPLPPAASPPVAAAETPAPREARMFDAPATDLTLRGVAAAPTPSATARTPRRRGLATALGLAALLVLTLIVWIAVRSPEAQPIDHAPEVAPRREVPSVAPAPAAPAVPEPSANAPASVPAAAATVPRTDEPSPPNDDVGSGRAEPASRKRKRAGTTPPARPAPPAETAPARPRRPATDDEIGESRI